MRIVPLLLGSIALLSLSLPAFADDYDCPNVDRAVDIYNNSGYTFTELDAYNRDGAGQGEAYNLLESPLEPGDSVTVIVNDGTGYHVFNIEAYDDDGMTASTQLDACSNEANWTIYDDEVAEEDDY